MAPQVTGKEKIMETALREFADRGYDGARMDRIAADAGVNKALIYYHFKSKEELYVATIDHIFDKALPEPKPVFGISYRESLQLLLAQFVMFIHNNPLFVKLMDQETLRGGSLFQKANRQLQLFESMLQLYKAGAAAGEFRMLDNPGDYVISMLGACYFFYSHRSNVGMFYPREMDEDELLRMRIRTLQDMAARIFFS